MAQEHELSAAHLLHTVATGSTLPRLATSTPPSVAEQDPSLRILIKTKSVSYFQWTAFAMLLAPIAFWIASRK